MQQKEKQAEEISNVSAVIIYNTANALSASC